ncbi:unnamed protein product [Somion occarium]
MRPDLATGDTQKSTSDPSSSTQRLTFGPFARIQQEPRADEEPATRCRAIFIFLRSLAKIYLLGNGQEHTFYLPFVVRKAWPLFPHGVVVQRILDPAEIEEAKASGDAPLPTLFTIINPHAEPAVVGLSSGIVGGFDGTPTSLKDDGIGRPLSSVPAEEFVLWTSPRGPDVSDQTVVTLDIERKQLSVWRYAYVPTKDLPDAPNSLRSHSQQPSLTQSTTSNFQPHSPGYSAFPHRTAETVSLSALPRMPPVLSTTTTMASLMQGNVVEPDVSLTSAGSGGGRPSLGGGGPMPPPKGDIDYGLDALGDSRMKADYWMDKLYSEEITEADSLAWSDISVGIFDQRWNGKSTTALLAICLSASQTLIVLSLRRKEGKVFTEPPHARLPAISVAPVRALRSNVYDLLVVKPNRTLAILTHGMHEIPIRIRSSVEPKVADNGVLSLKDSVNSSVSLTFADRSIARISINLIPDELLTKQCLFMLSMMLPAQFFFDLHHRFLLKWSLRGYSSIDDDTFNSFKDAVFEILSIPNPSSKLDTNSWNNLCMTSSLTRYDDDPAFRRLKLPPSLRTMPAKISYKPHEHTGVVLHGLHYVGLNLWLNVRRHRDLLKLATVVCKLAIVVRPEWADFWKRISPDALDYWPSSADSTTSYVDERLSTWAPDLFSCLYNRINNPDWSQPWLSTLKHATFFDLTPSMAFGAGEPLLDSRDILQIFSTLADGKVPDSRKRAENAILVMAKLFTMRGGQELFENLPLGLAAPLKEAARACQLSPSGDWPTNAFRLIGRNDLVELVSKAPDLMFDYGYRSVKEYLNPNTPRKSINDYAEDVRRALPGEMNVTGVELGLKDFIDIRFAQDRRVDEVARMLCSSAVTTIKAVERPDTNDVDQARELQNQVLRLTERTLALPFGRAMFTFGTVTVVTRETYRIPRMEYTARLQQQNLAMVPDPAKLNAEVISWADFHNGVASGLRISHTSTVVDSSWIKFNKPAELTPEHAGFLFALGLTGHLRELLTWHTFSYLTPKHDLTTTAVLLGLSAAYAGTSDRHVTKLIAVHLPALLPTQNVDLNITLVMQAAALSSIGLLYMGTKNRRMAEVCISQIGRKDLVPPDLSNDFREACTLSAALAFGMVMLGKGSDVPADVTLFERLCELIHGGQEAPVDPAHSKNAFDIHLTSPAATIALGLMYLRTERQDVAETLVIPDTVMALDRIQPHYLLLRTLAKSLILWSAIAPNESWLASHIPEAIAQAMQERFQGKPVNDSFELAYYNIVAGCCFALGLKFAGTATEEAYSLIVRYYDVFTRLAHTQSSTFDSKIKRAAVNDGLNLISISLSMVMAGTGEISCLRRFRYQYGKYNEPSRYGTNVAITSSLGLLFLGGGRFTLGTSDAAIACMVAAFFPRFPQDSKENKSYLQALRHLWVLAVEPRCLIARDVDSKELVYLPIKMKVRDEKELGTTQLICPTLIPEVDKLQSLRVDTPRYWPFYLDIARHPRTKESLLRSQILYVKRRTAFLSYMEDPKGSRSLFVRSGSSTGDAATLDFPQLTDVKAHPAADLHHFISSSSNDTYFLAFADRFCRDDGETGEEKKFQSYCHAALLDSILQDKSWTIQSHLTLHRYRNVSPKSKYFSLALHDLRFITDFYTKVYDRRFSGKSENNPRPSLLRETTLVAAMHDLDTRLSQIRQESPFLSLLREYAQGGPISSPSSDTSQDDPSRALAWYLQRHTVPSSSHLVVLKKLALNSHDRCLHTPPPHGSDRADVLDTGIREVLNATGSGLVSMLGSGWSKSSVDEIMAAWK